MNRAVPVSGLICGNRDALRVEKRRELEWSSGLTATHAVRNQNCGARSHRGTSAVQKPRERWRHFISRSEIDR